MATDISKSNKRQTETLSNITSAFMQELAKSSAAADLMRLKMKNIYESHSLLKEFEPSKIRVVTAKVSIPVAFDEHQSGKNIDSGITKKQLFTLIKGELPIQTKNKITDDLYSSLNKRNKNLLSNNFLAKHIVESGKKIKMKGFNPVKDLDISKINDFRNEWVKNKEVEQSAEFIYKADDLEKINPNNIVRIDLTIDVS